MARITSRNGVPFTGAHPICTIASSSDPRVNSTNSNSTLNDSTTTDIAAEYTSDEVKISIYTLDTSPFAKYGDQFAALFTEDAFDDSVEPEAVPYSGGFYQDGKYMDPFACYFRNVQLTDTGEYKTQSRYEC